MRLLQHMGIQERLQVLENNPQYIDWLREDYPDANYDDLCDLWLDLCIDYAGRDYFNADGIKAGTWWDPAEVETC